MKQGLVEFVAIMDKSGSMSGLEGDTIGGYNSMLEKQKQVDGECVVTTVLFDHCYELLHDRIDIRAIQPITAKEYQVGGSTALLDAMGTSMEKIAKVRENTAPEYRAEQVIFVIITDGQENSSRVYDIDKIKSLVEQHKVQDGWEFIFLGANIDAIEVARHFGIDEDRAQSFHADKEGIALNFLTLSESVTAYRQSGSMDMNWKKKIEGDYKRRGGKY